MALFSITELEKLSPVFRGRAGNYIARSLMHVLSLDKVNELYERCSMMRGPDFASAVLNDVGFEYRLDCHDVILPDGAFITVSNHPCGHVDGITLVDLFGHTRPDYKVMVNQILSRIDALEENFIPVTPTGSERTTPTAASLKGIKTALSHLRSGGALGLFPSGAVSDLSLKDRCIRDREWQEPVIRLIMKAQVPIVPVRFFDGNSLLYYLLGLIDWRIRLLKLPSEVFNKKGKVMHVGVGNIISPEEQKSFGSDPSVFASNLRASVYGMDWRR